MKRIKLHLIALGIVTAWGVFSNAYLGVEDGGATAVSRLHAGDKVPAAASRPEEQPAKAVASDPTDPIGGEWHFLPASKSSLPPATVSEIAAAVHKYAAGVTAWDVRYRLVNEQRASSYQEGPGQVRQVPAMRWEASVHEIAGEAGLSFEQSVKEPATPGELRHDRYATDGQRLYDLNEESHMGSISQYQPGGFGNGLMYSYRDFIITKIPKRTTGDGSRQADILRYFDDPNLKVLDERMEVNGHECYVLESRTVTHPRIFATASEATAWGKEHPNEMGLKIVSTNPKTAAREDLNLVQLAVDPQASFMPVRLRVAWKMSQPARKFETPLMPKWELRVTRVGKTGEGIAVPMAAEIIRYDMHKGNVAIAWQTRLEVEKVSLNGRIDPARFRIEFPVGTGLLDQIRGISYKVGSSPETLKKLDAAAVQVRVFYDGILGKAPPELHASKWLIGAP